MWRTQETGADPGRARLVGRQVAEPSTPSEGEAGSHVAFEVDIAYVFPLPRSLPSCPTQRSLGIVTCSRLIRGKLRHQIWGQPRSLGWLLPESLSTRQWRPWDHTELWLKVRPHTPTCVSRPMWESLSDRSAGQQLVSEKAVTRFLGHPSPAPPAFLPSCVLFLHISSWVRVWEAEPSLLLPGEQAPGSKSGTCTLTSSVLLGTSPTPWRQSFPTCGVGVVLGGLLWELNEHIVKHFQNHRIYDRYTRVDVMW